MTYQPRRMTQTQAAQAATLGDLTTPKQAARLTGTTPTRINRWIDRGKLPTTLINGRRYVNLVQASELEATLRHRAE